MKKLFILGSLGIIILLILFFWVKNDYLTKENEFHNNYNQLNHKKNSFLIEEFLLNYYSLNGEFPEYYTKIDTSFYNALNNEKVNNEEFLYMKNQFYLDPFSQDSSFFYYKPIYNRKSKKREECMLLSAGIDSKINNRFPDTLYVDDSLKISVYSEAELDSFSYLLSCFGKKDILFLKINGISNMKRFYDNYSFLEIKEYFRNERNKKLGYYKMLKKSICVKSKIDSITYKNNSQYIVCKGSDFQISHKLYYADSISLSIGDSIETLGICKGIIEDSIIEFINVITYNCKKDINNKE
jgi:hypothetical protein